MRFAGVQKVCHQIQAHSLKDLEFFVAGVQHHLLSRLGTYTYLRNGVISWQSCPLLPTYLVFEVIEKVTLSVCLLRPSIPTYS